MGILKSLLERIEGHYVTTTSGRNEDKEPKKKPIDFSFDKEDRQILENIKNEVVNRKRISTIDLNSKVDEFMDWYYKNMVEANRAKEFYRKNGRMVRA